MKSILRLMLLLASFAVGSPTYAADPAKEHTYTGDITGVVCISCKQHITAVLMKKLDGVVSVDVKAGEKADGPRKLIVVAKQEALTKDDAVKALGSLASQYQILSLTRQN